MIVELLMQMSGGYTSFIGSMFPPVDVPAWVSNPFFGLSQVVEAAAGWGVWVNIPILLTVAITLFATYGVTALVKLVRAVAAHIPLIGGNG